jgi:cytochrome c553
MSATRLAMLSALIGLATLTGACERQMADMYRQPKLLPLESSPEWADGRASRPLPPHTIPYSGGAFADASSGRLEIKPLPMMGSPFPLSTPLLARGRERFDIFCAPCHGLAGQGNGMIVRRGFANPPSYHTDRLRNAPDAHFFNVITNGYGAMYPYADRVSVDDRWAIVAYIRALQLSQHATLEEVPPAQRASLVKGPP